MSARNHGRMLPPVHEPPPYSRGVGPAGPGPMPHLKESRDPAYGIGPGKLPLHPAAIIEEKLAVQHDDIQVILVDNQRFAATHVALRQDLEATQFELHRTQKYAGAFHAEKDMEMRELHEKCMKVEMELRGVDAIRNDLRLIGVDINELTASKQQLIAQAQAMNQDLVRMTSDLHQVPVIRSEIEGLKQELQRARAAIEYEKKGYTENYEHGQLMENKLISMAREVEKLRAELANAEKGVHAAAAYGSQGSGYNAIYQNSEAAYAVNPYPAANYGSNPIKPTNLNPTRPVQGGFEGYNQYGAGHGTYGASG